MAMCLPPRNGNLGIHLFSKIVKREYENSMQMRACFNSGLIRDDLIHLQDLTANNIYTRKQESVKQDLADAFNLTNGDSAFKEAQQPGS
ncbi:hypothetical protein GJ496_009368 [Pomphorhynchus laevis]|nr:hypothetical protein GJ496_009368 [Pomphorhynchus laevis]